MDIAIAVTGASGSIYAEMLIEPLLALDCVGKIELVISKNGLTIWEDELGYSPTKLCCSKLVIRSNSDFNSPLASGSSAFDALVVIPCSAGVVGRAASGVSDSLTTRAIDVMLKERKTVIMVIRETPFNLIHLRNLTTLHEAGATIFPASPSFYSKPATVQDLVKTVTDRVMDHLKFENSDTFRWGENN